MIDGYQDAFVGAVSILLGVFLATVAATNWQWYYSLRTARFVESKVGRNGARVFYATLGLALIAMGIAIAMGIRP